MNDKTLSKKAGLPRWLYVGLCVSGVSFSFAIAAMIVKAVEMVRSGRGADTYRTVSLVEYNWVGFLVLIVVVFLALLLGLISRWHEHRQWRELEKKYGPRANDASQETPDH